MISINSSHMTYALQALHSVLKIDSASLFSFLLKLASINNSCIDPVPLQKIGLPINQSEPHQAQIPTTGPPGLIAMLAWIINDGQFHSTMPIDVANRIPESLHIQPETTHFRLAREIDKLYPPLSISLDNIDRLVVFGDSLSDSLGMMFEKTHHLLPSYNQYYDGRFTNGFVWDEYLSSPAFLKKETVSFAEGGSTSTSYSRFNLLGNLLSNLETQMKSYKPVKNDLAILLLGANDYITLHKDNIIKVVENQVDNIEEMLQSGVENILIMGMPDISLSPAAADSTVQRKYKDITIAHNALLQSNVEELTEKYPKKKIFFFDTTSALKDIINIARKIGYNTTDAYTTHGYIHIPTKTDPELNISPEYIYNDSVHPTQEVHYAFATILNDFIVKSYADKAVAA